MAVHTIRIVGDPVLRQRAREIDDIDASVRQLADELVETMYAAPGLGLAATQVGVQQRLFVYDVGDDTGPHAIVNPIIEAATGEWSFEEGCLSVPGLMWDIVRPKEIHLTGRDLDGEEVSIEADELLARLYQHELDHLDGVLLMERLDDDQQRDARRAVRELMLGATDEAVDDAVLRLR